MTKRERKYHNERRLFKRFTQNVYMWTRKYNIQEEIDKLPNGLFMWIPNYATDADDKIIPPKNGEAPTIKLEWIPANE